MTFTLNDSQVAQYHEGGFLLVRAAEHGLVEAKDLQAWAKQVQSRPKAKGKWMPYNEINVNGERQLMRTEKFVDYHAEFDNFRRGEGLIKVLAQLSGAVSLPSSYRSQPNCSCNVEPDCHVSLAMKLTSLLAHDTIQR